MWHIFLVMFFVSVMVKNELSRRALEMDEFFDQMGVAPFHVLHQEDEGIVEPSPSHQSIISFRMKFEFEVLPLQRPGEYRIFHEIVFCWSPGNAFSSSRACTYDLKRTNLSWASYSVKRIMERESVYLWLRSCLRYGQEPVTTATSEVEPIAKTVVKLLLLGPAGSGKSTVVKQMQIIHMNGFSEPERMRYRILIYENIIWGMWSALKTMEKSGLRFARSARSEDAMNFVTLVTARKENSVLSPDLARIMIRLWNDVAMQFCVKTEAIYRNTDSQCVFRIDESLSYFLDNLPRISKSNYEPTVEDVLKCRIQTTGIVELKFTMRNTVFRIFDVGGQRSQRKKWIHCFDDVNSVIFIAGLSDYLLKLDEDHTVNRMTETLKVFQNVVFTEALSSASLIVFFNKCDLFDLRLSTRTGRVAFLELFPDYKDSVFSSGKAGDFIKSKFEEILDLRSANRPRVINIQPRSSTPFEVKEDLDRRRSSLVSKKNKSLDRQALMYSHFTCATDTQNMRIVFQAVSDTVLISTMTEVGIF